MRFGLMLPFDLFSPEPQEVSRMLFDAFGGKDALFAYLQDHLDTVEISPVGSLSDAGTVLAAAEQCVAFGLELTIHGLLKEGELAENFFVPYLPLFETKLQERYNITLHPLKQKEDTARALKELCVYADQQGYPVTFTLENQRLTNEYSVNGTCKSVAEIVEGVAEKRLRTCFDFGHHLSNKRKKGEESDPLAEEFIRQAGHTHIHSMYGGTTHFPLDRGETELEENISLLLERNYDGILSLEVAFQRFAGEIDFREALCRSVSILKTAYGQVERKREELRRYREDYPALLKKAAGELEKLRCGVALLSPSSYLLKFEETRIAVDPSLLNLPVTQEGREAFLELLKSCDAVIYTHKHGDHYDAGIAAELTNNTAVWFQPDFFSEADIHGGRLAEKERVILQKDQTYELKNIQITTFESYHSSPGSVVPEYGFAFKFEGRNYVFPADVRTYDTALVHAFPHTEVLFAHLWLGREKALLPEEEYLEQFIEFVNCFGCEKVCLGHIFDVRREISDMWTDLHYRQLEDRIKNLTPLRPGSVVPLGV